jgi:transcriptional regulator with XRE-family HTH domain
VARKPQQKTQKLRDAMKRFSPEKLKAGREAAGLSQSQLAHIAGVDRTSLNKVERGHRVPTLASLARLAHAIGCTVDDLMEVG